MVFENYYKNRIKKKLKKSLIIFIRFFASIRAKSILWFQFFKKIDSYHPIQESILLGESNIPSWITVIF